jgi:hypothetical protein
MTRAAEQAIQEAFARAKAAINEQLDRLVEPLTDLSRAIAAAVGPAELGSLRDSDLADLVPDIRHRLETIPAMVGYGFAAAPGVMLTGDHYLLWFQQRASGIRRLALNLTADDPDLYDYFDMDWYAGAERLRRPSIYGPYVDYAGADFLVLTVAAPIFVGERFIGVAGADIDPDVLERSLVAAMRGLPRDAVVVNADRSVLAAGSARWMPGERLPVHPRQEPESWLAVGELASWTSWTFALAAPQDDAE